MSLTKEEISSAKITGDTDAARLSALIDEYTKGIAGSESDRHVAGMIALTVGNEYYIDIVKLLMHTPTEKIPLILQTSIQVLELTAKVLRESKILSNLEPIIARGGEEHEHEGDKTSPPTIPSGDSGKH